MKLRSTLYYGQRSWQLRSRVTISYGLVSEYMQTLCTAQSPDVQSTVYYRARQSLPLLDYHARAPMYVRMGRSAWNV